MVEESIRFIFSGALRRYKKKEKRAAHGNETARKEDIKKYKDRLKISGASAPI